MCFWDSVPIVSPQLHLCLCLECCKSLLSEYCFPLVSEVIIVFHCTICLEVRLLQTSSYAIDLGTNIFKERKFSILESFTARKHNASKILCNTDHLLNRLISLVRTLDFYYEAQLIEAKI